MKTKILFLLATLMIASNQLQAQPYASCTEPPEHEFPEESTLCDKHNDFDEDLQIGPSTSSSQLGTSYFQNLDIYITGTFYINSYIWFDNCRIKMAPGAHVYIYPSGRLAFWRTDVFACEQRWLGMTMANGSSLLSYSSDFEDADYLIRLNKVTGTLLLVNNVFNRNYIGIRTILASPSDNAILNFYTFVGNTFDCTAPLFEKWDNNLPDAEVSFAGIQTVNATGTIGQFNGTNRFQNMQHGVYAQNSDLTIRRGEFHDMSMLTMLGTDGSAIYAFNSSLRITDNPNNTAGTVGSQFLRNERAGILVEGTDLAIEDCDFDEINTAIGIGSVFNSSGEHVVILRNRFTQSNGTCVALHRSAASGIANTTNTIQNNVFDFTVSEDVVGCISIAALNMSTDNMEISSNHPFELSGDAEVGGIYIKSNSDNFHITSNEIDILTETSSRGLELKATQNVFGSFIGFNTITGGSSTNPDEGISIFNTPNLTMCDNTTMDLGIGHNLMGNNDFMTFSLNRMESHDIGLLVQGIGEDMPGVIGRQWRKSNCWFTPFDQVAAQNQSPPLPSRFFIDDPNDLTKFPAQIDPSSGWFFPSSGDPESCGGFSPYDPVLTSYDTLVINSSYPSPNPSDPAIWELNRRLMYKMKRFPSLQSRGGSYYTDDSTATYGLLAESDYRYFLAMQIDTAKLKTLDSLRLEIDTLFADIDLIDTVATPLSDTIVIDPVKDSTKYTLLLEITKLDSIQKVLRSQIRALQIDALSDVLDFNDTITVTEEWEINQKAVNHFMIRVARGDTLENEDLDSLRTIAGTCIEDGGFATLAASAFLPICEWADYEDVVCDRSNKRHTNEKEVRGVLENVYPNPASSNVYFEFNTFFSGRVILFDGDGKVIRQEIITAADSYTMHTIELSGLYLYQIRDQADTIIDSGKVIFHK